MKKGTGQKFKILIVDDNPNNIQVVGTILRENEYAIGYAMNGQQAIEILKNNSDYDLMLLDVDMPLMNGFETCRLIREDSNLKDLPVIFLTAFSDQNRILEGFDAGAMDYITKPFNSKELIARVSTHLKLKYKTEQIDSMNKLLELNNREITDSIMYASYIQFGLLPEMQILKEKIPDHFIFYKPRNIVSGDFYWFCVKENLLYIAAADCTGHGVPGAFVSILGISSLNEIVKDPLALTPAEILGKLRTKILDSLWRQHPESITNDGIELAICTIDLNSNKIQYAGASRPLTIVRENESAGNPEILEIKGDNLPIGIFHVEDKNFTNHSLDLRHNDSVYIYSDGFASQFGGQKNKKYSTKQLKELFLKIHKNPMETQKIMLEKTFNEWKGDLAQTDDILVIGFKMSW